MDDCYSAAGRGLKRLFIAEIFLLASNFIPVFSVACLFVGFVLSLVGLNAAAQAHRGFQRAMSLLVVNIAVNLAVVFVPSDGVMALALALAGGAVSFGVFYLICTTAANLVEARGDDELAQQGRFVWRLNLFCTVLSLVGAVLTAVPMVVLVLTIVFTGVTIASVVGGVLYLIFLYNASGYLRS